MSKTYLYKLPLLGLGVILTIGIVIFGPMFISSSLSKIQTYQAANTFLTHMTAGEFNQAFDQLAYFDKASDLEPVITYDDAKLLWVKRVNSLFKEGTYIQTYDNLRTWTDDTYPNGEVRLTVVENGAEKTFLINIHFSKQKSKWKVQSLHGYENGKIAELEKAISGYVGQ
jgi:hypothetical protein